MVRETEYGTLQEILKFPDHYVAIAVMVDDDIEAGEDGQKIVPRGSIVGGKTGYVLLDPTDPVVCKQDNSSLLARTEGVLLNDVDVTHGPKEGAMLIHGFVKIDALPYDADNEDLAAAADTALSMVSFIK